MQPTRRCRASPPLGHLRASFPGPGVDGEQFDSSGGSDSGQWFAEVRSWMLDLLPQAEDAVVVGAGHLLASSHTKEVATILTDFLHRYS